MSNIILMFEWLTAMGAHWGDRRLGAEARDLGSDRGYRVVTDTRDGRTHGGRDYAGRIEACLYNPQGGFQKSVKSFLAEGLGGFDAGGAVGGEHVCGGADDDE